jgi:hypothetical protein
VSYEGSNIEELVNPLFRFTELSLSHLKFSLLSFREASARCLCTDAFSPAALKLNSLRRLSGRLDVNQTVLSLPFDRSRSTAPKPAFSAVGRVSLTPTADSWAVRSGPPASVALIRLDYGFLLRRSGLLRIGMLRVAIFLI